MKQIYSIFLLFLLLVVGIQPTLAMHYCGGSLQSVQVSKGHNTHCCGANNQHSSDEEGLNLLPSGCCSSEAIQLSTDNYQIQEQQTSQNKTWEKPILTWFIYSILSDDLQLSSTNDRLRSDYPPKGFEYSNVDILTSISILII